MARLDTPNVTAEAPIILHYTVPTTIWKKFPANLFRVGWATIHHSFSYCVCQTNELFFSMPFRIMENHFVFASIFQGGGFFKKFK
jgi:lipopolysaccharide biosynthesis glycosyltransferase